MSASRLHPLPVSVLFLECDITCSSVFVCERRMLIVMHCVSHVSAATVNAQVRFQHEKHAVNECGWCSAWHAPTRLWQCVEAEKAYLGRHRCEDEFLESHARQIVRNFFQLRN